jgi:quercetin dioxygenase-like cupin family protein
MAAKEPIRIGALEIRYLQDGVESSAAAGMFELTVPPGARVPPAHSHSGNEEIAYVLVGVFRYTVDGETRDLGPGGPEPARMAEVMARYGLVVSRPG